MPLNEQQKAERVTAAALYTTNHAAWRRYFKQWFAAYYTLGTLLFICSATAASAKQIGLPDRWSAIFSWLVVMLTAAIGFFKPEDRGSRYRQAWSLLGVQLSRFFYDQTYTLNDVIRAYEQGEAIIHQAPAAPLPPQSNAPP
jgi:hypothetical protein